MFLTTRKKKGICIPAGRAMSGHLGCMLLSSILCNRNDGASGTAPCTMLTKRVIFSEVVQGCVYRFDIWKKARVASRGLREVTITCDADHQAQRSLAYDLENGSSDNDDVGGSGL